MSRRRLLRGAAVGAGPVTLPALLSACGFGPGGDRNEATVGSNASDAVPKDAVPKKASAAAFDACRKQSGKKARVGTKGHDDFGRTSTAG